MTGDMTVFGALRVDHTMFPGGHNANFTIRGSLNLQESATLTLPQLFHVNSSSTMIRVTGFVNLAGTLNVSLSGLPNTTVSPNFTYIQCVSFDLLYLRIVCFSVFLIYQSWEGRRSGALFPVLQDQLLLLCKLPQN